MQTPGLVMGVGRGAHRKDGNKREGAKESLLLFCWFREAGILAPDSAGDGRVPHRLVDGRGDPAARQGALTLLNLVMFFKECLAPYDGRVTLCSSCRDWKQEPLPDLWSQVRPEPSPA